MSINLLTITETTATSLSIVKNVLTDPRNLSHWVPAIDTVTPTANGFQIERHAPAINQQEQLQVTVAANRITYASHGEHLTYVLNFLLTTINNRTIIEEQLILQESPNFQLPLVLLKPIVQHECHANLLRLVNFCHNSRPSVK
ncbi:hypothetical protein LDJ81_12405 [Lentilactobacillus parabuchneri]|uniref:hypothetical protein n=1 Tax=Lentilactobacillus parabuchneri TaxID=152331 RepID=UPI0022360236|nr:hypothetical protein [Lentilactobacillus parabuchneri]MCW4399781.1 hypothetical protein [Lentilactobacillus parabuchneri]